MAAKNGRMFAPVALMLPPTIWVFRFEERHARYVGSAASTLPLGNALHPYVAFPTQQITAPARLRRKKYCFRRVAMQVQAIMERDVQLAGSRKSSSFPGW